MHLGKTLALFCLSPGALSYVITAYRNDDCSGESKSVNVWDNTCRDTNIFATKSIRVETYAWWADGGDGSFKKGACLKFDRDIHAYGSVSS
ncbi:unnamed protein product [Penicillium discolor]